MKWTVRHAAWLIPRLRSIDAQSPFYRALGGPHRGKVLEFGESVFAHLPEVVNPAPRLADRWKFRPVAGQERPHRRTSGQNR